MFASDSCIQIVNKEVLGVSAQIPSIHFPECTWLLPRNDLRSEETVATCFAISPRASCEIMESSKQMYELEYPNRPMRVVSPGVSDADATILPQSKITKKTSHKSYWHCKVTLKAWNGNIFKFLNPKSKCQQSG